LQNWKKGRRKIWQKKRSSLKTEKTIGIAILIGKRIIMLKMLL
jgi:hypothetical protein